VVDNYNLRVQVFSSTGQYITKFGSGGTAPGQFSQGQDLRGLAVDKANGWVYVVDGANGFVNKFNLSGTFIRRFGGLGSNDGQFSGGGRNVTVDGDGNVWVGDMPNFRFQKYDPNGNFLFAVPNPAEPPPDGGFNQPRGVAVDAQGNIFVTDTNNWRIQKFNAAGQFVTAWGRRNGAQSDGNGFNYARGIAVDRANGDVLVADTDNHLIKRFDNDGELIWQIGGFGEGATQFKNPNSVFVGGDGTIYVSDSNNFRVQVLSSTGAPIRRFGTKGNGNGQFQFPRGITADTDGSIWVADSIRGMIMHFSATGAFLGSIGTPGEADNQLLRPDGIRVDATNVYVADSDVDKIKAWTKSGTFVGAYGRNGEGLGQFQRPHGIDLTPDGHLYVVEQAGERVQELRLSTLAADTILPTGAVTVPTANQIFPPGSPITIRGTINDNQAVGSVEIDIRNVNTGLWWRSNGTWGAFQWQAATVATPGATTSTWQYVWNPPAGTGRYSVFVRFLDASGNIGATKPTVPFRVQ
jgi:sugar lactone lactonase YvrE